ncbi:MAG: hypothetical protein ACYCZP_16925, partial [Acidimicrobiales bacterium]
TAPWWVPDQTTRAGPTTSRQDLVFAAPAHHSGHAATARLQHPGGHGSAARPILARSRAAAHAAQKPLSMPITVTP